MLILNATQPNSPGRANRGLSSQSSGNRIGLAGVSHCSGGNAAPSPAPPSRLMALGLMDSDRVKTRAQWKQATAARRLSRFSVQGLRSGTSPKKSLLPATQNPLLDPPQHGAVRRGFRRPISSEPAPSQISCTKEYEPAYESKSAILKTIWAAHAFGMTVKKESTQHQLLPHKPHQPIPVIDRQFQAFHGAEADLSGDLNAQSFAD